MMSPTNTPLIVIAAGGTGGHMMPASALSDMLKDRGYRVMLITDRRGDGIAAGMADIPRHVTSAESHMTGGVLGKIKSFFSIFKATLEVRKIFLNDKPAAVIGFGGYPSMPGILAARWVGVPFALHEQNAVLGRVNRAMAPKSTFVALSYKNTSMIPDGTTTKVTGNPVRKVISKLANVAYSVPFGFGDIRILVLGGSQGARILSDIVPAAITQLDADLAQRLVISHQARPEDVGRVKRAYETAEIRAEVAPFFNDVASILVRTQLVIARSGASTLAECATMARPAILVPLKIAADDHQTKNAELHQEVGGAWIFKEADFTPPALKDFLGTLFDEDLSKLRSASEGIRQLTMEDSAETLAEALIDLVEQNDTAMAEAR